jgi:hypothetical protein
LTSSRRRSRDATTSHYGRGTTAGPELSSTALGVPAPDGAGATRSTPTARFLLEHWRVFCCRGVRGPGDGRRTWYRPHWQLTERAGTAAAATNPRAERRSPSRRPRARIRRSGRIGSQIGSRSVTRPGPYPARKEPPGLALGRPPSAGASTRHGRPLIRLAHHLAQTRAAGHHLARLRVSGSRPSRQGRPHRPSQAIGEADP